MKCCVYVLKLCARTLRRSGRRELSPFQNKVFWTLMAVAVCCGMLSLISVIEESVDLGRFAPYTGQAKAFV